MPRRILHLVHQYPPEALGGTGIYTQNLANAQDSQGYVPIVFYPSTTTDRRNAGEVEVQEGVRLVRVPVGPRSPAQIFFSTFAHDGLQRAMAGVLRDERPDLVHVQHLMGIPLASLEPIVASGIPLIVTLHDYWYLCANAQLLTNYDQSLCNGPRWWVNCGHCALARTGHHRLGWLAPAAAPVLAERHRRVRRILHRADQLIAPSQFVRSLYERLDPYAPRIQVISHGIQQPPMGFRHDNRPSALVTMHIAYVGGIAWQKGVHVLIEAVNGLPPDALRVTICGDTSAFPDYAAELHAMTRHPGIRFAGRVERAELWRMLADVDLVVVPSLWHETSSLVIQEAFAAGIPVIASDIGALAERVRNDKDGLLFPAGDWQALRRLLKQLVERPDWLVRLRQDIQPVRTMEEHARDVAAVYEEAWSRVPRENPVMRGSL